MTAASKSKGHKRKRRRSSAPLKASHDATRKQAANGQHHQAGRRENGSVVLSVGRDVVSLMNSRANAYFGLPSRIVRCHSPFELWREHARFMHEAFADYAQFLLGGHRRDGSASIARRLH